MTTWPLKEDITYTYRDTEVVLKVRPGRVTNGNGVENYKVRGEIYGDNADEDPSASYYKIADLDEFDEAVELVVNRVHDEIDSQAEVCNTVVNMLKETAEENGGSVTSESQS